VRIADSCAFLTIKGRTKGEEKLERSEFEYPLPVADAAAMLEEFCGTRVVRKLRYFLPAGNGLTWEIDEYLDENKGLFTAEIELPSPDTPFERPAWLGEEVSGDSRYGNGALSVKPYSRWEEL
jgi:CYTH domain-containing protein